MLTPEQIADVHDTIGQCSTQQRDALRRNCAAILASVEAGHMLPLATMKAMAKRFQVEPTIDDAVQLLRIVTENA